MNDLSLYYIRVFDECISLDSLGCVPPGGVAPIAMHMVPTLPPWTRLTDRNPADTRVKIWDLERVASVSSCDKRRAHAGHSQGYNQGIYQ